MRSFNPRTHTGCDKGQTVHPTKLLEVSIHAPTRGATIGGFNGMAFPEVSIHAPTRGATKRLLLILLVHRRFNPRTHTGCDSVQSYIL